MDILGCLDLKSQQDVQTLEGVEAACCQIGAVDIPEIIERGATGMSSNLRARSHGTEDAMYPYTDAVAPKGSAVW